jgi:hypothetical protein
MARPKLQKSILSLKSWLFTPATKSDRFTRAADVHSDALIIDLEDAVAPSAKTEARETALRYLAGISADRLPCALRINSPDTRFGLDDLRALLNSPAKLSGTPEIRLLCAHCPGRKPAARGKKDSANYRAHRERQGYRGPEGDSRRRSQAGRLGLRGCGHDCGPWGGDCLGAPALGEGTHYSGRRLRRDRGFGLTLFRYC